MERSSSAGRITGAEQGVREQGSPGGAAPSGASANDPGAARVCPDYHAAVEMIGKRWTGAILWALTERPHYFAELSLAIPGLSDRLLSRRLRELEGEGLVKRSVHAGTPARVSYSLTDKGRALEPAIRELRTWAKRWNGDGSSVARRVPRRPRAKRG